jgi:hypothetical protein
VRERESTHQLATTTSLAIEITLSSFSPSTRNRILTEQVCETLRGVSVPGSVVGRTNLSEGIRQSREWVKRVPAARGMWQGGFGFGEEGGTRFEREEREGEVLSSSEGEGEIVAESTSTRGMFRGVVWTEEPFLDHSSKR